MHVAVEGERLRTQFAGAPRVALGASLGSNEAVFEFDSSLLDSGGFNWVTVVRFMRVLDFRFFDFELGLEDQMTNSGDLEYCLIEIIDSGLVRAFVATGALRRTAVPIVAEEDLRHYRIAFDDHGIYDVVCLGVELGGRRVNTRST